WIRRLDHADTARTSVHVYRVKFGDAKQMARVLTDMFVGGSGTVDTADNQVAPGSGLSATNSLERLSLNSSGQSQIGGFARSPGGSSSTGGGFGPRSPGGPPGGDANSSGATGSSQRAGVNVAGGGAALDGRDSSTGGTGQAPMQGLRITPDVVNNSILIYADQGSYRIIESTLQQLDRPPLQVAIDATIAEVTLTNELSYGVQFYLKSKGFGLPADKGSLLNTQATQPPRTTTTTSAATGIATTVTSALINRAFPGFNFLLGSEASPTAI